LEDARDIQLSYTFTAQSADVSTQGLSVSPTILIGGQYRLCWCSSSGVFLNSTDASINSTPRSDVANETFYCETAQQFRTDAGNLLVIGPTPLTQDRTCVSGQTCTLDGIVGKGFGHGEAYSILDTCGTIGQSLAVLASSNMVVPEPQINFTLTTIDTTASLSWGSLPLMVRGGRYRLCWCYSSMTLNETYPDITQSGCFNPHDFITDAGELTIIGASPWTQDRTCISGQTCSFNVIGEHLSDGDSWLVLDTCAEILLPRSETLLPRFPAVAQQFA